MQKNVRTKLLNDYSQLGFKGKSTCVKYRYDYNGVTVNLYFDAFDPDSNTLTMILSTEKQFYFTTLNSMNKMCIRDRSSSHFLATAFLLFISA